MRLDVPPKTLYHIYAREITNPTPLELPPE
jgi:hypothetical protein